MATAKTFKARLERLRGNLGWIIATVPFDVQKTWGAKSRLKVMVEVGGESFRTSLFPTQAGKHFILVNKKMQKAAGGRLGDLVQFSVAPDLREREVKDAPELTRIIKQEPRMRDWYAQMTYSYRQAIAKWISEPKSAASRAKRADEIAERILLTMEAERELPPQLKQIFERTPNAHKGWAKMTPIQRRSHLFAIFGYKSIGSRNKRTEKAVADAVRAAERAR